MTSPFSHPGSYVIAVMALVALMTVPGMVATGWNQMTGTGTAAIIAMNKVIFSTP
jgi:hypothetical protein